METPDPHHAVLPAEGWYLDPYGRHADRWYSEGQATALVRHVVDGRQTEGHDEPSGEASGTLTPVPEAQAGDGGDLLRAGASGDAPTASDLVRADEAERPAAERDPFVGVFLGGAD